MCEAERGPGVTLAANKARSVPGFVRRSTHCLSCRARSVPALPKHQVKHATSLCKLAMRHSFSQDTEPQDEAVENTTCVHYRGSKEQTPSSGKQRGPSLSWVGHNAFICPPAEAVFRAGLQEHKLQILAFAPPRNHWELSRSVRCCKEEELTFSGNMQAELSTPL